MLQVRRCLARRGEIGSSVEPHAVWARIPIVTSKE